MRLNTYIVNKSYEAVNNHAELEVVTYTANKVCEAVTYVPKKICEGVKYVALKIKQLWSFLWDWFIEENS